MLHFDHIVTLFLNQSNPVVLVCVHIKELLTTNLMLPIGDSACVNFLTIQHSFFHSDVQEVAGADALDGAAAEPSGSLSAPEAASSASSSALAASSSPGPPEEATYSPKEAVAVEADRASQVSGSGCTSQASVDDDDDVPITDIYFVSTNIPSDMCSKHKAAAFITSLIF